MPKKLPLVKASRRARSCPFKNQGDGVQFTADFFSMAQLPVDAFSGPAQFLGHSARYPSHVKDGMALEYLRQAIRQVTDEAFAGPLAQFKN